MLKKQLILPAPINISLIWNFGSLLLAFIVLQTISGLILSIFYYPLTDYAFISVVKLERDVPYAYILRAFHANTARVIFFCIYAHIARGLYYKSSKSFHVWISGATLFLLSMATAFLGYVLPWGQIRFWGASVITNLLRAIPYIGPSIVKWIWGGFAVSGASLSRFYSLHFLLPFLILLISLIHIMILHTQGSSNPLGFSINASKISFHRVFSSKDFIGLLLIIIPLSILVFFYPFTLSDPENFIPANPLTTPLHIKPEWYFLWAYAILRSIPNKGGGGRRYIRCYFIFILNPSIYSSLLPHSLLKGDLMLYNSYMNWG